MASRDKNVRLWGMAQDRVAEEARHAPLGKSNLARSRGVALGLVYRPGSTCNPNSRALFKPKGEGGGIGSGVYTAQLPSGGTRLPARAPRWPERKISAIGERTDGTATPFSRTI